MTSLHIRLLLAVGLLWASSAVFSADDAIEPWPDIKEATRGLQLIDGFFPMFWDARQGRMLVQIGAMDESFLYQPSLARGVGSNDLLLDRGQLGTTRVVKFYRAGPRILLIEDNLRFRAQTEDMAEKLAVASSFARSVIWGFDVIAQSGDSVLVDASAFFLRDAHELSQRLVQAQQGSYTVDPSRSAFYLPRSRGFPDNSEVEVVLTYTGLPDSGDPQAPDDTVLASVLPDATALTVHLHHSFIRLPDDDYQPLLFDPRAGIIQAVQEPGFIDYASPIGAALQVRHARRHRLHKTDPEAAVSDAIEPIVYYLDPGVPEPVRSALLDGARWWQAAFEAAGYRNAYEVHMLPDDADPMDVRYNVIQWVHRSTRGWSYGSSVVDPRTGEIIKGHVSLGSLRVRQDYLLAEGLLAPHDGVAREDAMLAMSLARIRQLSAHEVGHTLGLAHNFAASVNQRASVMDYPFPLIRFDAEGEIDLSDAYGVGIADWDKRAIAFAYQDFPAGVDAHAARQAILTETLSSGLLFVDDNDARDPGSAHPQGNLWDNGADAIAELEHLLKVRAHALARFSANNIRPGRPLAELEEVLVPIYLLHRYQIEAVGKLLGGLTFTYGLRGDGQARPQQVSPKKQKAAMAALMRSIEPDRLLLPQQLLDLIPPRPPGYPATREGFSHRSGTGFDPLAPPQSAVRLVLEVLLHPARAARMNQFHAQNPEQPDFAWLLQELFKHSWYQARDKGLRGRIQQLSAQQVMNRVGQMLLDQNASVTVRAQALQALLALDDWLSRPTDRRLESDWRAHYALAKKDLKEIMESAVWPQPAPPPSIPPGSPIGATGAIWP